MLMWDLQELTLSLLFELAGPIIFERFSEKALGWLKVW
jgi:hypothetical protein